MPTTFKKLRISRKVRNDCCQKFKIAMLMEKNDDADEHGNSIAFRNCQRRHHEVITNVVKDEHITNLAMNLRANTERICLMTGNYDQRVTYEVFSRLVQEESFCTALA